MPPKEVAALSRLGPAFMSVNFLMQRGGLSSRHSPQGFVAWRKLENGIARAVPNSYAFKADALNARSLLPSDYTKAPALLILKQRTPGAIEPAACFGNASASTPGENCAPARERSQRSTKSNFMQRLAALIIRGSRDCRFHAAPST